MRKRNTPRQVSPTVPARLPERRGRACLGLAVAALFLLLLPSSSPPLAREARTGADGIQRIEYSEATGRLSLETKDAPLEKVLQEISRVARITVISDGALEGKVTVYIDDLPLDRALRKVLRGQAFTFEFAATPGAASSDAYRLTEVRIFLGDGDTSQGRRYTYDRGAGAAPKKPYTRPRAANTPRIEPRIPPPPRDLPSAADIPSQSEAKRVLSDLMDGNLEALNEIAERMGADNPQVQEQIDRFLESMEESRQRAEEQGYSVPPMEGLGGMGMIMQQLMKGRNKPPAGPSD